MSGVVYEEISRFLIEAKCTGNAADSVNTGIREAPLTDDIARATVQIQLHRDPADRFLAATAQVLELTWIAADEKPLWPGTIRSPANR